MGMVSSLDTLAVNGRKVSPDAEPKGKKSSKTKHDCIMSQSCDGFIATKP